MTSSESAAAREPARTPDDLFRLFVERANAGDLDGLSMLYEPGVVAVIAPGEIVEGIAAVQAVQKELLARNLTFTLEGQLPSVVAGDLALTSAMLAPGVVTAEVARRQPDGTWRWVIDNSNVIPQ